MVLPRLDRPVLAEQALAGVAVDSDHGPVGLLTGDGARVGAAGRVAGNRLEERLARGRPVERLDGERPERRPISPGAGDPHPHVPGLALGKVEVAQNTVAALDGAQAPPVASIVRDLDRVVGRLTPGLPVEDEPAELPGPPEVQREPGRGIGGSRAPRRGRVAVEDEIRLVPAAGRRGARHRRRRRTARRRQRRELELVDPDAPPAPAARGHGELDRRHLADLTAAPRAPGEADMALLDDEHLPLSGEVHVAPHRPPHVLAGPVDELELEVIGRRFAPDAEGEGVVVRQMEGERLPGDGVTAAAREGEIEAHGPPAIPGIGADRELDAVGRESRPSLDGLEIVDRGGPRARGQREEESGAERRQPRREPLSP